MLKTNANKIIFFSFCFIILLFMVKGIPGNPTSEELNSSEWRGENGPFETSNDHARFALIYSAIEDKSLQFSLPLADFSTPDLAINSDGKYVSLFAPGVSFLAMPGYLLGKYFGHSQTGAFLTIIFFALLNIILLRAIAIKLGANPIAASLGAFVFIFATPAFAYATTIYQHHISTFIILFSLYLLLCKNSWRSLAVIWFMFAFSVVVDNPNLFLMLPIALFSLGRIILIKKSKDGININLKLVGILAISAAIIPTVLFLSFNKMSNGSPFQIAGTLERVISIDEKASDFEKILARAQEDEGGRSGVPFDFFHPRNLMNGFYIHFFSPDRGIIRYAPIVLFGILGLMFLYRKNYSAANVIIATIGFNILLYSMWGDPQGGWAFGSRYLIPSYALLSLGIALALTKLKKNYIFLAVFMVVFFYSARINTLGAVTTSANPPQIGISELEKTTGIEEKYTEERNWEYLQDHGSRSYVYQTFLKNKISAEKYFYIILIIIILGFLSMAKELHFSKDKK
jgi:hypothetical protein